MELDIKQFDPTTVELQKLVSESQGVTTDITLDEEGLKLIKKTRIGLRDARVKITKRGKELRDDATKFAKAVIDHEKELVAIIAPEEDRLQGIENEVARQQEIESRKALLPERRGKLDDIGDGIEVSDEALLEMDTPAFMVYLNDRMTKKLAADREMREKKEREEKEKAEETARKEREEGEKKMSRRRKMLENIGLRWSVLDGAFKFGTVGISQEEAATLSDEIFDVAVEKMAAEITKLKDIDAKEAEEKRQADIKAAEEKGRKDAEAKAAKDLADKERFEKEEKEHLEKEEGYKMFLSANGYTEETKDDFIIVQNGAKSNIKLFKIVATYHQ